MAAISDDHVVEESGEDEEEFADEEKVNNTIQGIFSAALGHSGHDKENDDASISIQNIFKKAI